MDPWLPWAIITGAFAFGKNMKWSGWEPFPLEIRRADGSKMGEGRGTHLHLSHVLSEMSAAAGEKVWGDAIDPSGSVIIQEGFLWETALEYVAAGMAIDAAFELAFKRYMVGLRSDIVTQIALEKDGIHMTPDGLDKANGQLESYKFTRRSLSRAKTQTEFETNFWKWIVQEKSYCYAAGVDTVRWIVLFQASDYGKGVGTFPVALQSAGQFTLEELVENWKVVRTHEPNARKRFGIEGS